ncbi:bacterio-opsin activator domain-containing protein [Natronosalvus caseinilyticus]|uniref:bacterio-opsin activator domain-containing protein n=1 Tax=Natronosalvus caseinilyticus TaxID=2953747 RepID=UPI0028ADFEFC|nr:bacterio-opsin activator domain-containing protein [Natronosalvus caseinilyticus]
MDDTDGRHGEGDVDRAVMARAIDEAPIGVSLSDPSREDNPLVYVNPAFERLTGYDGEAVLGRNCRFLQGPDSSPEVVAEMRAAIEEERPTTVELRNYRDDGTEFWNEVTIAPVRDEAGTVTHYVGFQNDVTARKAAEFALEERTEELEYILDRVEGLIQDMTSVVAGSTSRSDLETAVCSRIAEEAAYEGVWIGERNPATDTLEVRASVGVDPGDVPIEADHPATTTLDTGSVAVDTIEGWTHASFPLDYNGVEYGTLTVCSAAERDVDDRETIILSALTRAVASGINARETSRMLATDAVVVVELEIRDRALAPVAISAETDGRLEYRRSVHRTGDDTASLFTVTNADAEELAAAADGLEGIDLAVLVERTDRTLIELDAEDDLVEWLSERGILVQSIEAEDGRARVSLGIPHSTNVRGVVEAVQARYDGADVLSFRQRERGGETSEEFAAGLEDALTDRQFASLQRAYLGGYFEWPRPTTGEELASSMGVSRPTFHEHLRNAEAKLCRAFFGDERAEE